MRPLAFPWEMALHHHRARLETAESRLRDANETLTQVEDQLSALQASRRQLRKRLAALFAANPSRQQVGRVQARLADLWLQMLSLRPLVRRRGHRVHELEGRRYRANRDVESLERVKSRKLAAAVPLAAS